MSPKRKGEFVRVTAYIPEDIWNKTVSYMCHNAVADNGKPILTGYGAISNTVSNALDNYCNIVYDYSVMNTTVKEPTGDVSVPVFTITEPTKIFTNTEDLFTDLDKPEEDKKDES